MRIFGLNISWGKQKDGTYFYPLNGLVSRSIGYTGEEWIDVDEAYRAFNEIPKLSSILKKKGLLHANVDWLIKDKTGAVVPKDDKQFSDLYKLLQNPNPAQGQNDFIVQRVIQINLYGNQFLYKNKPTSSQAYPSAIWNISARYMAPYLTGNVFDQTKIDGIISKYVYKDGKNSRVYKPNEILYTKICDIDNPIVGISPLKSATRPLTILLNSHRYLNKALANSGAMGLISADSVKGSDGAIPLKSTEKERITRDYLDQFGVNDHQKAIWITEASLKFQAIAPPVKNMMVYEAEDMAFMAICDHFGIHAKVFSSKGTKFDDFKQALINTYQDTIVPEATSDGQNLTKFLMTPDDVSAGFYLCPSVEHIPILKTDKKDSVDGIKNLIEGLSKGIESKIISPQQAVEICEAELESLRLT